MLDPANAAKIQQPKTPVCIPAQLVPFLVRGLARLTDGSISCRVNLSGQVQGIRGSKIRISGCHSQNDSVVTLQQSIVSVMMGAAQL